MSTVQVVQGFSLTNRWLLYASLLLAPAQYESGIRNNCPSNIGFLVYNWYTQIGWYRATKAKQLHALSLLPIHFNILYALTYLGGITSGNIVMGLILGVGTAGVLGLNTAAAWTSWASNMPEGYGIYQFFFFGWRTLNSHWHTFMLVWQIFDTIFAVTCAILAITESIKTASLDENVLKRPWIKKYLMIPLGAATELVIAFPLILWAELIVARNRIESATDWISVWLFVAQVGALLMPSCSACWGSSGGHDEVVTENFTSGSSTVLE